MARSRFDRLGDHRLQNKARKVRERAAAGDPEAVAEAATIDHATTPEAMREKCWEILRTHLADCDSVLAELGLPRVPKSGGRAPAAYADALDNWVETHAALLPLDTLEGRLLTGVKEVAHILHLLDNATSFDLGMILGYGLAQNHFLALREFSDGPALARERALAEARSAGAKARGDEVREVNREIAAAFIAAWRTNPHITANSWANANTERLGKSPETLRKIASKARKVSKAKSST